MKQHKTFKRSMLALAIGLTVASGAFAQSSVGSIYGHADNGAKVTVENASTGQRREITADATGRFSISQLAPGTYKVGSGSQSREVIVRVGTGSQVELKASTLTEIVVTGAEVNPIDMSSVESTSVFTAEQLQKIPVGRDVTNVALLAPGTVKGDTGFGNLASFGGSSVAENGY
ncbi:MAG TPA: carboxypeptidase-like regulatory domain-containing protein [Pseudomonadota bacterium]|nr:carboxypeptidase-like regulatory domain-containing protein [Pseudomonadota bacterium]